MDGPLHIYRARVKRGELKPDPAQELLAEKLQSLHRALDGYVPSSGLAGWKARLGLARRRADPPQGLYIYGGVGVGKSMLMDSFFDHAPIAAKRRVHFHEFMNEVHDRLHEIRQSRQGGAADPIAPLARRLAAEAGLLCFDEFQVDNIVDAMLLGRLFEALFAAGVVVVATSNRPPMDLYKDGLKRDRFLPFIELLSQRLDIFELAGAADYRLERILGMRVYHVPADAGSAAELDRCFRLLTNGGQVREDVFTVKGRSVKIPASAEGVARADFDQLCAQPLAAADFLAIAERYHTVILDGIPVMGPEMRNEARRLVILIDALYEHRVNFICSAAAPPAGLYPAGDGQFEFERLVSRLIEMQSADYLSLRHVI